MNDIPWLKIFTTPLSRFDVLTDASYRQRACEKAELVAKAFARGDYPEAFMFLGDERRIHVLLKHHEILVDQGIYERWLVDAYTHKPFNRSSKVWRKILSQADRVKLKACGDPLPAGSSHILYRGTADSTRGLNLRGISWTSNPQTAAWFALQFGERKQAAAAVYKLVVPASLVFFCSNERGEQEYVVNIWKCGRLQRVPMPAPVKPHI